MENEGFVNIVLVIAIIVILGVAGYFAFVKKLEPMSQAPISTLTPVEPSPANEQNFKTIQCETVTYRIENIDLEGISIAKVIEDIGKKKDNTVCSSIKFNLTNTFIVGIATRVTEKPKVYNVALYKKDSEREKADPFNQSVLQFRFDLNRHEVYFQNQFDGGYSLVGTF